jgi:hypothetical protein
MSIIATSANLLQAGSYPLIKKLRLHFILLASLAKQRWQFILYARTQADQRMAKEIDYQKDFFFYLLRAKDPETGQGFEVGELWEEAAVSILLIPWEVKADFSHRCSWWRALIRQVRR